MSKHPKTADLSGLYPAAIRESFAKLDPRVLWRNPVMFTTAVVAAMTTLLGLRDLVTGVPGAGTALHISAWLWLCVLFANFAEALAEGRGKARADTLRATKSETRVRVLSGPDEDPAGSVEVLSTALRPGQYVYVSAGEIIPTDGEARTRALASKSCRRRCAPGNTSTSRRARSFPPTAKRCAAWPPSTKAPSRANPPR